MTKRRLETKRTRIFEIAGSYKALCDRVGSFALGLLCFEIYSRKGKKSKKGKPLSEESGSGHFAVSEDDGS